MGTAWIVLVLLEVLAASDVFALPAADVSGGEGSFPQCGPGEVFKECESSSCGELSCAQPEPTDECTRDCAYQCFCVHGLYRNSLGICVPLAQCDKPRH
ncbi:chymotrypsin-elastase inhibitor ixodidin-like [Dermacentor albipictus]|uniref:chymotrypsin-elastase inhibitor ixodidin-like n=1 Tax=Dermacentor albipictus TaxID=60249 RepID=UPI0038FC55A7